MSYVRPASAYTLASDSVDVQAVDAPTDKNKGTLVLYGYSVRESAGSAAAATVFLRNGDANTDPILAVIELAANGSETVWLGDGVVANDGIWVDRTGSAEGAIYYGYNV